MIRRVYEWAGATRVLTCRYASLSDVQFDAAGRQHALSSHCQIHLKDPSNSDRRDILRIPEIEGNVRIVVCQGCERVGRGHFKCCGPEPREIFSEGHRIDDIHRSSSASLLSLSRSSAHRSSF